MTAKDKQIKITTMTIIWYKREQNDGNDDNDEYIKNMTWSKMIRCGSENK